MAAFACIVFVAECFHVANTQPLCDFSCENRPGAGSRALHEQLQPHPELRCFKYNEKPPKTQNFLSTWGTGADG
jgi:hypothetical protein